VDSESCLKFGEWIYSRTLEFLFRLTLLPGLADEDLLLSIPSPVICSTFFISKLSLVAVYIPS
jgi:hypothetical protein